MRVKYRLRPNTFKEGWVAEVIETDDPELNSKIKYTLMFGVGYGETKGEAVNALTLELQDQAFRNKVAKAHEKAQLVEEHEMEI